MSGAPSQIETLDYIPSFSLSCAGTSRFHPNGATSHPNDIRATLFSRYLLPVSLLATWPIRRLDKRNLAAHGPDSRQNTLAALGNLNRRHFGSTGDPETAARIEQYELAFRMQTSVPELADLSGESAETLRLYGLDQTREDGGFARNCLLARRLVERGCRFVQLMHRGWDQHVGIRGDLPKQCHDIDQPAAALVQDLKRRGLLDDTLVIWSGEFGRTVYAQGDFSGPDFGRDQHGRCYSLWMAGGGLKRGLTYGATDDYSYNVVENPVHPHDLNATILHLMGIDHTRLTHRFQGRDYRLTDIHGQVVNDLLA